MSQVKHILFMRHGRAGSNEGGVHKGEHERLTKVGREQIQKLADKLHASEDKPDSLIASTMDRARESAIILAGTLRVPIYYDDLFVERRKPQILIGKSLECNESLLFEQQLLSIESRRAWPYPDGECFEDLRSRAKAAVDVLQTFRSNRFGVVGHGYFARCIFAYMLYGENLTLHIMKQFIVGMTFHNAGAIWVEHDPRSRYHPWRLLIREL